MSDSVKMAKALGFCRFCQAILVEANTASAFCCTACSVGDGDDLLDQYKVAARRAIRRSVILYTAIEEALYERRNSRDALNAIERRLEAALKEIEEVK